MSNLFTDRALEWGLRAFVLLRFGMLLFISWALEQRVGWIDGSAVIFAAFLIVRSLRPKPTYDASIGEVHVHTPPGADPATRARAIDRALREAMPRGGPTT